MEKQQRMLPQGSETWENDDYPFDDETIILEEEPPMQRAYGHQQHVQQSRRQATRIPQQPYPSAGKQAYPVHVDQETQRIREKTPRIVDAQRPGVPPAQKPPMQKPAQKPPLVQEKMVSSGTTQVLFAFLALLFWVSGYLVAAIHLLHTLK